MSLPFHLSFTPSSSPRTNETGQRGCRFWSQAGEDVTITHLGRWVFAGNSQTHVIGIYDEAYTLLGSVTVDCSGATPGEFLYVELATPVVVTKSAPRVYILSNEVSGGDMWNFAHGVPGQSSVTEDIGYVESAWYNPDTFQLISTGGIGTSNGPVSFRYTTPTRSWTKSGTTYTTNGVYYQIVSAMADADVGDTVLIPAGTYTWGEGGTQLSVKAGVILSGAGQGVTTVNFHETATHQDRGFTYCLLRVNEGSVVRDITFVGGPRLSERYRANLFTLGAVGGWRITNVTFTQQSNQAGYFIVGQYAPNGLVDNCTINGGHGTSELVFTRGPNDSWDTPHSMGGPENIFIEDCVFNGAGYVNDANSNARHVVRNCTINGGIKIDGHGVWTNGGPVRGCRHIEAYRNTWTLTTGTWAALEIRGGGGRFWGNTANAASGENNSWFFLTEYGMLSNNGAFGGFYQTPNYYPVRDQIGRGKYATPTVWQTATSEPVYLWNNVKGGLDWAFSYKSPNAAAIAQYAAEEGNPAATFSHTDIIQADRDYFKQAVGATFDGTSGVGVGTRAQMDAITPTKTGVGFWVTDEGSWDTLLPDNTSGQLYVWDGAAWVLDYVPYTYPHPQRGSVSAPSIATQTSDQTVDVGDTVVMSVVVTANPSPTYQWRKDTVIIVGATSSVLTITYANRPDEGSYDCVVTNVAGAITSTAATLTVLTVGDVSPPTPNPATFASVTVVSSRQITVVATTATDTESSPVEYNFAINDVWTGWQSAPLRYFTELTPSTEYTLLVKSRDAIGNEGQQSEPSTATTNAPEPTSPANVLGNRGTRARRLGIF